MSVTQFGAVMSEPAAKAAASTDVRVVRLEGSERAEPNNIGPQTDWILIARKDDKPGAQPWTLLDQNTVGDKQEGTFLLPTETSAFGVSRRHLALKRADGGWKAEIGLKRDGTPTYVGVERDGWLGTRVKRLKDQAVLHSGAMLRLGSENGPQIKVEFGRDTGLTEEFKPGVPPPVRQRQTLANLKRGLATTAVAGAVAIGAGVFAYEDLDDRIAALDLRVSAVDKSIEELRAEATAMFDAAMAEALEETPGFDTNEIKALTNAAYLVRVRQGDLVVPVATAWPISANELATNAHVALELQAQIDKGAIVEVCSPSPYACFKVTGARVHEGYKAFDEFAADLRGTAFPGAYDVAVLTVEGADFSSTMLRLAADGPKPGEELAFAGYLLRGTRNSAAADVPPTPQLRYGDISALTNFFLYAPADGDPTRAQLVNNSIPVTGGASGGPIINADGEVVAIVSSGTVIDIPEALKDENWQAAPSGVLLNYAQRIDVLTQWLDGKFNIETEKRYWQAETEGFTTHREYLLGQMEKPSVMIDKRPLELIDTRDLPLQAEADTVELTMNVEADTRYRLLAFAKSDVLLRIEVELGAQDVDIGEGRGALTEFRAETDGMATVTVRSHGGDAPTGFEFFVYATD